MQDRKSQKLVVIVGPTASGKSALAMEIAKRYDGEIICADSRTVYKGMDIGTAKPSLQDRTKIPHHLIDVVDPGEHFTAADFKARANKSIDQITARGKLPIMVGGTGLYVDSVIFNYEFGPKADSHERSKLESKTIKELHDLCRLNNIEIPINYKNKRHLIRAIELGSLTPRKYQLRPNTLVVGLSTERQELRTRIEKRAQHMVDQNIVNEVNILSKHYGWDNEAMTGNIYKILKGLVMGEKDINQVIEEVVRSDMSLAKRQLTWFKRNKAINWGTAEQFIGIIDDFVKTIPRTS